MWQRKNLAARLADLFAGSGANSAFYDDLEDVLIEGDLGATAAIEIVEQVRARGTRSGFSREELLAELRSILSGMLRTERLEPVRGRLNVVLVMGVNGVGKTTTIAKLAHHFRARLGLDGVLLSAADTYRAAAIEQLQSHGERLGVPVVSQASGADPGAVVYDSIASARARGMDVMIADTAGRMHNKAELVRELQKIDRVIRGRIESDPYLKVLVIDATTGQNALTQTETFHEAVGLDSLILAKYDSTARGGIAVPICRKLGLPFSFMGVGEKREDLIEFDRDRYLRSLLGID